VKETLEIFNFDLRITVMDAGNATQICITNCSVGFKSTNLKSPQDMLPTPFVRINLNVCTF